MTSSGSRTATAGADVLVYLGLGTNLGDRAAHVRDALRALRDVVAIDAVSDVYESEPFGYHDQPRFWNLAVRARTTLEPEALLHAVKQLETRLGRVPTFRMGPRSIDIDVLLYDDRVVDTPTLRVPHPGLLERAFVLRPLLDLDPDLTHTATGERLDLALRRLDDDTLERVASGGDFLDDNAVS